MSGDAWLQLHRGSAPLIVSLPHTGTEIPPEIEARLVSPWLARHDADWWIDRLYDFARDLGATVVRTTMSRTVIDVNRDPSGVSLYPGQATTGLCPTTTFEGAPLYHPGAEPRAEEIERRRRLYFDPYHAGLAAELARLRGLHRTLVVYDAHSILSRSPTLFEGELAHMNLGTNAGTACDPALTAGVEVICDAGGFSRVTNGRFRGGWITRNFGRPEAGVHVLQMELAMRGYMDEPAGPTTPDNWPTRYDPARAVPLRAVLLDILKACVAFAEARP